MDGRSVGTEGCLPGGESPQRSGGEFINLTPENLAEETLCCIVRTKKPHPGVEAKRRWIRERLREGQVFRKLRGTGCAFIEYAPLETAWVPVEGEGYLYIYCLFVQGEPRGQGYGRALMEYCLADARARGCSGVCMMGADKQKAWLTDQEFAAKFGFRTADRTEDGYRLLALSFDGTLPRFTEAARRQSDGQEGLTVFYDDQCPYSLQRVEGLSAFCTERGIPARFVHVTSAAEAKALPCVFNNWAVLYNGRFETLNQIDGAALEKIIRRAGKEKTPARSKSKPE